MAEAEETGHLRDQVVPGEPVLPFEDEVRQLGDLLARDELGLPRRVVTVADPRCRALLARAPEEVVGAEAQPAALRRRLDGGGDLLLDRAAEPRDAPARGNAARRLVAVHRGLRLHDLHEPREDAPRRAVEIVRLSCGVELGEHVAHERSRPGVVPGARPTARLRLPSAAQPRGGPCQCREERQDRGSRFPPAGRVDRLEDLLDLGLRVAEPLRGPDAMELPAESLEHLLSEALAVPRGVVTLV